MESLERAESHTNHKLNEQTTSHPTDTICWVFFIDLPIKIRTMIDRKHLKIYKL